MSFAAGVGRWASETPEQVAIQSPSGTLSYAALTRRAGAAAAALAGMGVGRGDRVAVLALNHPETLVLLLACARLGAMLLPLNWRLAGPELEWIRADARPRVLFADDLHAGVLEGALPLGALSPGTEDVPDAGDAADPLLLVYTSGTTGRPKGAVLTGAALLANAAMSRDMHALTSADRILTVLPLFHVGGMNIQTTPALLSGASVILHPRFDPAATIASFAQDRPTLTVLVPSTLQAILEHPAWPGADLSSLRAITTGSTVVPPALTRPFVARGVPVLQVYGATETCPIAIYTRIGETWAEDSTGRPGKLCEARVVDDGGRELPPGRDGEVLVRGPAVFSGYWNDPAATEEALRDGWFHTGDIGRVGPDGGWLVHDRKKNLIVSGGENIYPAEIERVLAEHPSVLEAAVVGAPDPRWQEVPVAYVVLRPGAACTADELKQHVRGQLARFKTPRDIRFVDRLPRNAMGKVQHALLRAAC
ncbi:MAG TPA: AMP-binding protein [Acetobacteraceae bacterium]|nr:AMP-binding protein [Acetobacteraceae bacterium]